MSWALTAEEDAILVTGTLVKQSMKAPVVIFALREV